MERKQRGGGDGVGGVGRSRKPSLGGGERTGERRVTCFYPNVEGTVLTPMGAVLGRSVEPVRGEGTSTRGSKGKQKQQKHRADGELPKRRERKRMKEMVTVIKVSWTEVVICCVPQRSRLCHQDRGVCKRLCKGAHIHMYHGHTCRL